MSHQPRRGFSIDTVAGFLDRTVFSVTGASVAIVAAFLCTAEKCDGLLSFISWFDKARGPLSVAWPRYIACFVAAKTVNRALNRLVLNHGWKADKPVWSHAKGEGDIVLVTGGSSGIGRCVIDMLAEKTTNIVSLDIVAPEDAPAHFKHYQCDITDPKAVAKAAEAIRKEHGNPTILFNNAGMSNGRTILNTSSERFLLTFKVNVLGPFNILHEFLPHIVSINHGHIVTTCSAAAFSGTAQMGDYCASKAASLSLHESVTHELDCRYNARRVRTSIVLPAKTRTPLSASLAEADNQFISPTLTPEQVARRMVDHVESGLGGHSVMPGSASTLLPLVRFMPFWYGWLFSKVAKTGKLVTDELVDEKERVYKPTQQLHQLHGIASSL